MEKSYKRKVGFGKREFLFATGGEVRKNLEKEVQSIGKSKGGGRPGDTERLLLAHPFVGRGA